MIRRDIRLAAEAFLEEHHPALSLPIPIEEILELKLGVDILPIPGLAKTYQRHGVLLSSGKVIVVDDDDYTNYETRCRFTLAHELAHVVLHRDYLDRITADSTEAAWKAYSELPAEQLADLERDASLFAGYLLVPQDALVARFNELRARFLREKSVDITQLGSAARDHVAIELAPMFNVSDKVVARRLEEDDLL